MAERRTMTEEWKSLETDLPDEEEGEILVWKESWNKRFIFWASFVRQQVNLARTNCEKCDMTDWRRLPKPPRQ
jgi:hypothetical protein